LVRPHRSLLLFVRSERQTFSAPCAFRILLHFPCREEPRSVNRPASLKPDNFFLLIYRALRQRRIPLALRVVAHTLLLVALVTGLIISILQAATQINEMTLSFIPKIISVFVAIVVAGPWMLNLLLDYMRTLFSNIPYIIG